MNKARTLQLQKGEGLKSSSSLDRNTMLFQRYYRRRVDIYLVRLIFIYLCGSRGYRAVFLNSNDTKNPLNFSKSQESEEVRNEM